MNSENSEEHPPPTGGIQKQERDWAMWCHISGLAGYVVGGFAFLGPLILWLIKKDEMPFLDDQGKEAVNFGISITIYLICSALLAFVFIGFLLLPAVFVLHVVCCILAGTRAGKGEYYRYPLTIRLLT